VDAVDHYVALSTRKGQVTLFPRVFGRGLDFQVFDKSVRGKGGVHVIQVFLSEEVTEEIQIMGRTCRQGDVGSYKMILLEDDLLRWSELKNPKSPGNPLLTKQELDDPTKAKDSGETKNSGETKTEFDDPTGRYTLLDRRRRSWFGRISQQRSKVVKEAKAVHDESKQFQKDLIRAKKKKCFKFLEKRSNKFIYFIFICILNYHSIKYQHI
jgi:preprotein translocase subunit SecA